MKNSVLNMGMEREKGTTVLNCSKQADNKLASMEDFIMSK